MQRWPTSFRHHHRTRRSLKNRHKRHPCGDEVMLFTWEREKRKKNMHGGAGVKNHRHITASPHLLPTLGLRGSVGTATKLVARPCVSSSARVRTIFRGGIRGRETVLRQQDATVVSSSARRIDDRKTRLTVKAKALCSMTRASRWRFFMAHDAAIAGVTTRPESSGPIFHGTALLFVPKGDIFFSRR
jgi:hypothetical protein